MGRPGGVSYETTVKDTWSTLMVKGSTDTCRTCLCNGFVENLFYRTFTDTNYDTEWTAIIYQMCQPTFIRHPLQKKAV